MSGVAIIINGANYSSRNLGKVHIHNVEPDPSINYLFIDQSYNTDNQVIISGDINGSVVQSIFSMTHRYLLKNSNSDNVAILQLKDDDSYTTIDNVNIRQYLEDNKIGDEIIGIFVKLPIFYYKVSQVSYELWKIGISLKQVDNTWQKWEGDKKLCASFVTNDALGNNYFKSYPNVSINRIGGLYRDTFQDSLSFVGFQAFTFEWCNILKLLYLFKYGSVDVSNLGQAVNYFQSVETGGTMSLGMKDTTKDSKVQNFLGIEGFTFPTYIGDVHKNGTDNIYTVSSHAGNSFSFSYPLSPLPNQDSDQDGKMMPVKRLHIENLNFTPKELDINDPTNYNQYWRSGTFVWYAEGESAKQKWCYKNNYRMKGNEIPQNGFATIINNLNTHDNSEVVSRLVYDANLENDFTIVKTFKDFKDFE